MSLQDDDTDSFPRPLAASSVESARARGAFDDAEAGSLEPTAPTVLDGARHPARTPDSVSVAPTSARASRSADQDTPTLTPAVGPPRALAAPASPTAPAGAAAAAGAALSASHDRYVLEHELGRGGMGAVYQAYDRHLDRRVALKVLHERLHLPDLTARFVEEAQASARLEHPAIVPIHDLGVDAHGRTFFTMKLVEGRTLASAIDPARAPEPGAAPLRPFRRLEVFIEVARAIAFAHERGIVHRDLKPSNIMLGRHGEVHVMDWGLAKLVRRGGHAGRDAAAGEGRGASRAGGDEPAGGAAATTAERAETVAGTVLGTPAYLSPEQAMGATTDIGPAADIFALGATLYHLVVGRPPYQRNEGDDVIERAKRAEFPPPRAVAPRVPRELEAICLRAMALRREDRYASASALADDVQAYLEHEPIAAYPEGALGRLRKAAWRRRRALAIAALLGLVAGALVFGAARLERERDERRTADAAAALRDQAAQQLRSAEVRRDAALAAFARGAPPIWERRAAAIQGGELRRYFASPPSTDLEALDRLLLDEGQGDERAPPIAPPLPFARGGERLGGARQVAEAAEATASAALARAQGHPGASPLALWRARAEERARARAEGLALGAEVERDLRRAVQLYGEAGERERARATEGRLFVEMARLQAAAGEPEAARATWSIAREVLGADDLAVRACAEAIAPAARVEVEVPGAWEALDGLDDLASLCASLEPGAGAWVEVERARAGSARRDVVLVHALERPAAFGREPGTRAPATAAGVQPGPARSERATAAALARALGLGAGDEVRRATTVEVAIVPVHPVTLVEDGSAARGAVLRSGPAPDGLSGLGAGAYSVRVRDARAGGVDVRFPVLLASGETGRAALPRPLTRMPRDLVYVPAGPFLLGSRHGAGDERPLRFLWLDAFFIGRTEVTVREILALAERSDTTPGDPFRTRAERVGVTFTWDGAGVDWALRRPASYRDPDAGGGRPLAALLDHPAVHLAWEDAEVYARALGARLPSELEWEKAARGIDGRRYPWGDDPADAEVLGAYRANHDPGQREIDGWETTSPVGFFPSGASPYGALDMAGNAWELCENHYLPYAPTVDPVAWSKASAGTARPALAEPGPLDTESLRALRGGGWPDPVFWLRTSARFKYEPTYTDYNTGFRIARDP